LIEAAQRSTTIPAAPGVAVLQHLPTLTDPVVCSPGIESRLLQAFDAESLPAAS